MKYVLHEKIINDLTEEVKYHEIERSDSVLELIDRLQKELHTLESNDYKIVMTDGRSFVAESLGSYTYILGIDCCKEPKILKFERNNND